MNRSRNRQARRTHTTHRSSSSGGFSTTSATPYQETGTTPTMHEVVPGASVFIVLKADQSTGRETHGTVDALLTRGNHPRGIKVRLRDGRIGRVQRMGSGPGQSHLGATSSSRLECHRTSNPRYTDARNDEAFATELPARNLADFIPSLENVSAGECLIGRDLAQVEDAVCCPVCEVFRGDELAVTHHIEREHFS